MKNGGGALETRFSAARFLHSVEGRGGFEGGGAFRIMALIEAVKSRRGVAHRLPTNPEILGGGPKSKSCYPDGK